MDRFNRPRMVKSLGTCRVAYVGAYDALVAFQQDTCSLQAASET